ncbi:MAG: type III pantothenate kinase [Flavobacteriaceae bacterium]|mgnify:CR=1 FL=1
MNLIIDIGNTRVKLAVFKANRLLEKVIVDKKVFLTEVKKIISNQPKITNAIVSSVDFFTKEEEFQLRALVKLTIVSHDLNLPFTNNYATPKTLGVDRIALITAAAHQYPSKNVLVIDAGTCVTYDFLNQKNTYLGGAISPGLTIRYEALHNLTAKLPLLETDDAIFLIGNTTEKSIHSGVSNGLVNEIDGTIKQYQELYTDLTVILTGGDTNFLAKRLKSSIFANSNFLLEGLNHLLKINID